MFPFAIKEAPLRIPFAIKGAPLGFPSVSKRLHEGFLSVSKWPKKRFPRVCFCLIDFYSFRKVAGTLLYVFSEFASDTIKVESCLLKYSRTPDLTCLN